MIDKFSINIVGAVDHTTRLYNRGEGFRGMSGTVSCAADAGMYVGFIADRDYVLSVEGDLVQSTETNDSRPSRFGGVYGFDVDWSDTAKARGLGSGKIVIVNPAHPDDVSVVAVTMEETPGCTVTFADNSGKNVALRAHDKTNLTALEKLARALLDGKAVSCSLLDAANLGLCNVLPGGDVPASIIHLGPEKFRDPQRALEVLSSLPDSAA